MLRSLSLSRKVFPKSRPPANSQGNSKRNVSLRFKVRIDWVRARPWWVPFVLCDNGLYVCFRKKDPRPSHELPF